MKSESVSPYMTTSEVAEYLRLSRSTILAYVKEGKLKPGNTNRKFIFRREDVIAFGKTLFG